MSVQAKCSFESFIIGLYSHSIPRVMGKPDSNEEAFVQLHQKIAKLFPAKTASQSEQKGKVSLRLPASPFRYLTEQELSVLSVLNRQIHRAAECYEMIRRVPKAQRDAFQQSLNQLATTKEDMRKFFADGFAKTHEQCLQSHTFEICAFVQQLQMGWNLDLHMVRNNTKVLANSFIYHPMVTVYAWAAFQVGLPVTRLQLATTSLFISSMDLYKEKCHAGTWPNCAPPKFVPLVTDGKKNPKGHELVYPTFFDEDKCHFTEEQLKDFYERVAKLPLSEQRIMIYPRELIADGTIFAALKQLPILFYPRNRRYTIIASTGIFQCAIIALNSQRKLRLAPVYGTDSARDILRNALTNCHSISMPAAGIPTPSEADAAIAEGPMYSLHDGFHALTNCFGPQQTAIHFARFLQIASDPKSSIHLKVRKKFYDTNLTTYRLVAGVLHQDPFYQANFTSTQINNMIFWINLTQIYLSEVNGADLLHALEMFFKYAQSCKNSKDLLGCLNDRFIGVAQGKRHLTLCVAYLCALLKAASLKGLPGIKIKFDKQSFEKEAAQLNSDM